MSTNQSKKTVFIVITRGFIIRNILRSGILSELVKRGHKVVVFLTVRGSVIPEYLKKEFESTDVVLEAVKEPSRGRRFDSFQRIFNKLVSFLVYTDSTWVYSQIGNDVNLQRNKYKKFIERFVFGILSRIQFLKKIARFIDAKIFVSDCYSPYFEKYHPNVVFSTSIISLPDIYFMKEARKRNIRTVSMPKGWDNVTKSLYRFVPDLLLVHNTLMKKGAIQEQRIAEEKIQVCGFPQFDWYRKPEIILSREVYLNKFGIGQEKRVILFGSEGVWAPHDDRIVDMLLKAIEDKRIVKPCTILLRPHYSDIKANRFERFRNKKNIILDETLNVSDVVYCNWDPGKEETELFINSIYHCDVMVTTASTLVLDACCFDKPIVAPEFGVLTDKEGNDVSPILYHTDHFQAVTEENAIDLVKNEDELIDAMNRALIQPEYFHEKRVKLLTKMCYSVDGHVCFRMVDAIVGETTSSIQ